MGWQTKTSNFLFTPKMVIPKSFKSRNSASEWGTLPISKPNCAPDCQQQKSTAFQLGPRPGCDFGQPSCGRRMAGRAPCSLIYCKWGTGLRPLRQNVLLKGPSVSFHASLRACMLLCCHAPCCATLVAPPKQLPRAPDLGWKSPVEHD